MASLPKMLNFITPLNFPDVIRVGNQGDGGYIIPRVLLQEVEFLVSLGVSNDWTFDRHFKEINKKLTIHAYDHTISQRKFLNSLAINSLKFVLGKVHFTEILKSLKTLVGYKIFFQGNNVHYIERVHSRVDEKVDVTIDTIMQRTGSASVFLKIDIEGAEYRILSELDQYSTKILGLVIEFHDTWPFRDVFISKMRALLTNYAVVHIHPNNFAGVAVDGLPEVMEITLLRRDYISDFSFKKVSSAIDLDRPNNPKRDEIVLKF